MKLFIDLYPLDWVNGILRRQLVDDTGYEFIQWAFLELHSHAHPDAILCEGIVNTIEQHIPQSMKMLKVMSSELMAMAKALIRKAKQDGFNISVKETGVTLVDGGEFPDLNDIEMERLRTLWTEIVDVMHSRGAWASLITDGSYYFVCRRSVDMILDDSPNPRVFNFVLSPLLGNRGLVNLGAPPDDL